MKVTSIIVLLLALVTISHCSSVSAAVESKSAVSAKTGFFGRLRRFGRGLGPRCLKLRGKCVKRCPKGYRKRAFKCYRKRSTRRSRGSRRFRGFRGFGGFRGLRRGRGRGKKCLKLRGRCVKRCPRGYKKRFNKCFKKRSGRKFRFRGFRGIGTRRGLGRGKRCLKFKGKCVKRCPKGFRKMFGSCHRRR